MGLENDNFNHLNRFAVNLGTFTSPYVTDCYVAFCDDLLLTGNLVLAAPVNPIDGQQHMWRFIQDATGSRTLTLNAIFDVPSSITVTLSTTAGKCDHLVAIYRQFVNKWEVTRFTAGY